MYIAQQFTNDFENRDATSKVLAVSEDIEKLRQLCEVDSLDWHDVIIVWKFYDDSTVSQYISFGNEKSVWYEVGEVSCL